MPHAQDENARQLESLREDLLRLGSMVEHALLNALKSLEDWDTVAAAQVIQADTYVDAARRAAEARVIHMIAAQQGTMTNPELLASAFAIAGELERIGDYACSIARRVERITRQAGMVVPPPAFYEMARTTQKMLNTSLAAFLRQDVALACSLQEHEERVDSLEGQLHGELLALARTDPQRLEGVIGMLDIIHALERAADRATNIGERVIYLAASTGEGPNH